MRRRSVLLGLLAVAAAGGARAEQSRKLHRIAVVDPAQPVATLGDTRQPFVKAFLDELRRSGYVEGGNFLIEPYSGEGRTKHYNIDLARDVVRSNPDLIIADDTFLTLALKAATTTIPIVFVCGFPVERGVVPSLVHPGGNITGVAVNIGIEQWGKRYQLLRQLVPNLTTAAVIETREYLDGWEAEKPGLGRKWGVTFVGPPLSFPINEAEYRRVFASLAQSGVDGIVVADELEHRVNLKVIVELAEKNRLPVMYPYKLFVEAGGLMSYGIDDAETGHNVAVIVGQILKGAKPADIPIFQPTKFELAVNLKTAKALGLTVPPELLATADEVIE
jgi:putative ABC transport system substrate-binding protein